MDTDMLREELVATLTWVEDSVEYAREWGQYIARAGVGCR